MSCHACPPPALSAEADDDAPPLPSAEAMLAGTLALMTGVVERAALAQPLAAHGQSLLMANKVRSNLFELAGHPHLSAGFRAMVQRLRGHWDRLALPAAGDGIPAAPDAADRTQPLWHAAPQRVQ